MATTKPTLKATPPVTEDPAQQEALNNFLKEPERKRKARAVPSTPAKTKAKDSANKEKKSLPWEQPGVSERVVKSFNLRIKEPDYLKLKFVFEQSRKKSVHAFCLNVVLEEVARRLKKLL